MAKTGSNRAMVARLRHCSHNWALWVMQNTSGPASSAALSGATVTAKPAIAEPLNNSMAPVPWGCPVGRMGSPGHDDLQSLYQNQTLIDWRRCPGCQQHETHVQVADAHPARRPAPAAATSSGTGRLALPLEVRHGTRDSCSASMRCFSTESCSSWGKCCTLQPPHAWAQLPGDGSRCRRCYAV